MRPAPSASLRVFCEAQEAVAATGEQVMVVHDYAAGRTAPAGAGLREAIEGWSGGRVRESGLKPPPAL